MDRAQLKPALLATLALLFGGVLTAPAGAALSAETLLEPTTVVVVDLQLPQPSVEALEAEPDEYVQGTMALYETDGTPAGIAPDPVVPGPITVGVRLKGSTGSFRDLHGKAAFKVKFNEFVKGQKFLGLKKLTLNNMVQDASMLHESLVYPAFRAAGIPAPHTGYAYVYVNGVDYGMHLNLETMDDLALEKRFGEFDDPQHLYEGGPFFDVTAADLAKFEVDEGDEEELGDLEALIAAAAADSPSFSSRIAPVADLDEMRRFWAAERYLGHWDGYSGLNVNNYYLYGDPEGVFQMLPWGTDQTLQLWSYPFTGNGGLLFDQCLAEEACLAAYLEDLEAVAESTSALALTPRAEALAAQLAPWQAQEIAESERELFGASAIAAGIDQLLEFLDRRPGVLAKWLDSGEPPAEPDPEEEEPAVEPPKREQPAPPDPPAVSTRLGLDRSQLGRGLLIARPAVSAAGTISLLAELGTPEGRRRACAAAPKQVGAGGAVLRCRLTDGVRSRLARGPLGLQLTVSHQPAGGGPAHDVTRLVRLPRQAF
ncbi:MAG: hypothetical protein QOE75_79 [Solirubrobacterales bacterium]|jgi:hypothetical protein|nr:hypothetical protein [Solirubrobacterales bacterium]